MILRAQYNFVYSLLTFLRSGRILIGPSGRKDCVAMLLFADDPLAYEEDSRRVMSPFLPRIRRCVERAFRDYLKACRAVKALGPALDYQGSRPHCINALVVERIRREFARSSREVRVTEENGFLELQILDARRRLRYDLRFKLVDASGHSCNSDTTAQRDYRNQLPLLGDGDARRVVRLTIGWRWNVAATELVEVCVVYEKGDDVLWKYPIKSSEPQETLPIITQLGSMRPEGAKYSVRGSKKNRQGKGRGRGTA